MRTVMLTVYGIKNCNTMKKCFDFLTSCAIEYQFFDYKKQVVAFDKFQEFMNEFGLDKVVNKQGTTYKKLTDDQKAIIENGDISAIYELIINNQSIIKRPIVIGEFNKKKVALIGFDENMFRTVFE